MATPEQMDEAAVPAGKELDEMELDRDTLTKLADWWDRWFKQAGHKRLGRLMVAKAREE